MASSVHSPNFQPMQSEPLVSKGWAWETTKTKIEALWPSLKIGIGVGLLGTAVCVITAVALSITAPLSWMALASVVTFVALTVITTLIVQKMQPTKERSVDQPRSEINISETSLSAEEKVRILKKHLSEFCPSLLTSFGTRQQEQDNNFIETFTSVQKANNLEADLKRSKSGDFLFNGKEFPIDQNNSNLVENLKQFIRAELVNVADNNDELVSQLASQYCQAVVVPVLQNVTMTFSDVLQGKANEIDETAAILCTYDQDAMVQGSSYKVSIEKKEEGFKISLKVFYKLKISLLEPNGDLKPIVGFPFVGHYEYDSKGGPSNMWLTAERTLDANGRGSPSWYDEEGNLDEEKVRKQFVNEILRHNEVTFNGKSYGFFALDPSSDSATLQAEQVTSALYEALKNALKERGKPEQDATKILAASTQAQVIDMLEYARRVFPAPKGKEDDPQAIKVVERSRDSEVKRTKYDEENPAVTKVMIIPDEQEISMHVEYPFHMFEEGVEGQINGVEPQTFIAHSEFSTADGSVARIWITDVNGQEIKPQS